MKKVYLLQLLFAALVMSAVVSCDDDDDNEMTTEATTEATTETTTETTTEDTSDSNTGEVATDITLSGKIEAQMLIADSTYALEGIVYITEGTLSIPAGTIIYGKEGSVLVIGKGAKIEAKGTAAEPIIMTSSKLKSLRSTGDWAGLVIVGNASSSDAKSPVEGFPSASDGGFPAGLVDFGPANVTAINDADNSGILSYVRIEYAGNELTPNNEINSLTLAGVGSGTQIDHIHVAFAKDDAVEAFGGTVDINYWISTQTQDDDLDLDDGYAGNVKYALVWKNAKVSDQSGSSAVESGDKGTQAYTISNLTAFGPLMQSKDAAGFNNGIQLKGQTGTADNNVSITNSIFAGWADHTEGEKDGEFFGTDKAGKNPNLDFSGNILAGGAKGGDTSLGEATEYEADNDVTNLAEGGYKTVFPNAGDLLEGDFSGFTPAAITPADATKGATAGTNWNLTSGWVLFDASAVTY